MAKNTKITICRARLKTNKNGIRILTQKDNLLKLFSEKRRKKETCRKSVRKQKDVIPRKEQITIPQIKIMSSDKKKLDDKKSFEKLIESSLSGKDLPALLREKNDEFVTPESLFENQKLQNYPSPQDELDLHGYTVLEAEKKIRSFIHASRTRYARTVRIIVGKGLHSPSGAVLPDIVEDEIICLKKEKQVFAYKWDNHFKRKSGAIIVFLE